MQTKFNFYDFVGYVIPGAIALALIFWLCIAFFTISLPIAVDSIGESIVFVGMSYLVGHIVQAYSSRVEPDVMKKWGGIFSERFLDENDDFYSMEFKNKLKEAIQDVFSWSTNNTLANRSAKKSRQEIFYLCYALIIQENAALHTEIFLGLYSLHRGMLAAFRFGSIVSLLILVKQIALRLLSLNNNVLLQYNFFKYDELQLIVAGVASVGFLALSPLLEYRYFNFAQHFANSVYRNFYAWYKRSRYKQGK